MIRFLQLSIVLIFACNSHAQKNDFIKIDEVKRIESFLASDEMKGRRAGSPEIDKAAAFIADEFRKAGLQPWKGENFLQPFSMLSATLKEAKAEINEQDIPMTNVAIITTKPELKLNEKSVYDLQYIKAGESFGTKARSFLRATKNTVVMVDTSFTRNFSRLNSLKGQMFPMEHSIVFVLGSYDIKTFTIKAEHTIKENKYSNVVGILPGKSKKQEYVIFSGHYDHLGITDKAVNGDSIYNGANDDAAGTTAVIALASHFKKLNNNERTIVFAAFTAEEVGGFGSQYFSRQFDPALVMAMFNIEMIGTESKWGKNSAFITGFEKTNMGEIMQRNLEGSSFKFEPDPYPKQNLFYRSDNATLALLGVPAHTISTSKMDSEPNYHQLSDEVSTIDFENMTEIIKAIALSSRSIIAGTDTPARVKPESLR